MKKPSTPVYSAREKILLALPSEIRAEGNRRAAAAGVSLQHVITLALAMAWHVPPPPLRKKGRPRKTPVAEETP